MTLRHLPTLAVRATACAATLAVASAAWADSPTWAQALSVRATSTECGSQRFIVLKASAAKVPIPATEPGCTTREEVYSKVFVAKAFFKAERRGPLAESNVDGGIVFCKKDDVALLLGKASDIERAFKQNPAPKGCTFSTRKYQYVASVGDIRFSNLPDRGTMTVAESLAMHAKERQRIIAECNASPACQAEVQRRRGANGKTLYTCPPGYYLNGMIDNPYATCVPN
jgi:hypothetical protein